mmetsp:Transcript_41276/g.119381  ORF Transcript_41276/g.119381 Transcript_41276/m.119381 type:complete len:462 (+) Transcript_41276:67-1452(+)
MQWSGAAAALQHCCSIDFCESQLGTAGVRTRLRVGTTIGLRDEPLNAALSQKRFEQMPGASVDWVQMPRDMNAVAAMLNGGLLDLAAIYSEDVMAQLSAGNPDLRICGMFQAVPRRWCCLVPPGYPKETLKSLPACLIAIPSSGVAAKLMVAVLRERLGLSKSSVKSVHYDELNAAMRSLVRGGRVNAILWEVSVMERCKAKDWCDIVDEFIMPWPSHLLVAHKETLFSKLCTIRYFMCFTNLFLQDFQMDATGEALEYFKSTYSDLPPQEVKAWMRNATWTCSTDVELAAVEGPLDVFVKLEMLPPNARLRPARHLARGVRFRNSAMQYQRASLASTRVCMPAEPTAVEDAYEEASSSVEDLGVGEDEEPMDDIDEDPTPTREGSALCLPDARLHNLLSRCPTALCSEGRHAADSRTAAVSSGEKTPTRATAVAAAAAASLQAGSWAGCSDKAELPAPAG